MPRYKRTRDEAELDVSSEPAIPAEQLDMRTELRNMWEFASLMQYIYLFGSAVRIEDDFDIEDLEAECLKPTPSERLAEIGLKLLKYVSSHRGLTPDIFDEYTRRQYLAKAPARNPFGEDEDPAKFNEMDIYTRIRILHQLSLWTLGNVDRMRSLMPDDEDHLNWRMEPLGWDADDNSYFVLDDNRLYRRSDEPLPPPTPPRAKPKAKPKAKAKGKGKGKAKAKPVTPARNPKATRSSKRIKMEEEAEEMDVDEEEDAGDDTVMTNGDNADAEDEEPGYGFTNKTWECMAVTLEDYQSFMATIFRSRDPNEKELRKRLEEDVMPIIEKRAESLRNKQLKKIRELENLQKMASAKRSSRLADKADKEKEDQEKRELEEKRQRDLKMAHEEELRQRKIEEGHESRRLTREQRLKEREVKRILHEEELAKLQEMEELAASESAADRSKRVSERQTLTQKEQHKKELELLAEEEGNWYFDCSRCGMHGENLDDGSHSVACDKCGVWQHSQCHGFTPEQAEEDGFTFVCATCKRKEEDAKKPKIPTLKLGKNPASSPPQPKLEAPQQTVQPAQKAPEQKSAMPSHLAQQLDRPPQPQHPSQHPQSTYSYQQPQQPQQQGYGQAQPGGYRLPPVANFAQRSPPPQQAAVQQVRQPSTGYATSPPPQPSANGRMGAASPHQQQHQYVHQHAVTSAGGHPGYQQQPYAPQSNGHHGSQALPPMQHQAPPHQQGQWDRPQPYAQPPPQQRQQLPPPTGAYQQNGFQSSPVKQQARPVPHSPSQHPSLASQSGAPSQSIQSPSLSQSPRATLPPPVQSYNQHTNGGSPVKSSPPRPAQPSPRLPQPQFHQAPHQTPYSQPPQPPAYQPQPTPQQHRQSPSPSLAQTTPQHTIPLPPPSSNGFQPYKTPEVRPQSAAGPPNGADIAADGMSGPWPDGSKAIPQKKMEQSPAALPPPSSIVSQGARETSGLPEGLAPIRALAPSPRQPTHESTIPVKKMMDVQSSPVAPLLPPIHQVAPSGSPSGPPSGPPPSAAPAEQQEPKQ